MLARPYRGSSDLPCMTAFAAHNLDARQGCSYWHPGDIVWMMLTHSHMGLFDNRRDVRLWLNEAGECVALAWFYGPRFARFDVHPNHADLGEEVLAWVEGHVATMNPDEDGIRLRIDAMDDDEAKTQRLASAGYRAGRRFGEVLCCELARLEPAHAVPDGMTVRDCVEVDEHDRAQCHRDAWSSLDHIGRPQAVSQFHDHIYRALRKAIRYDPELDLVVANDDELVACSIAWTDEISGFGVFEPVGTCPGYRGLRLSGLLTEQSMLRLRDRGMRAAYVMSSESNNPTAYKAYRRTFDPIGRQRFHYKDFALR